MERERTNDRLFSPFLPFLCVVTECFPVKFRTREFVCGTSDRFICYLTLLSVYFTLRLLVRYFSLLMLVSSENSLYMVGAVHCFGTHVDVHPQDGVMGITGRLITKAVALFSIYHRASAHPRVTRHNALFLHQINCHLRDRDRRNGGRTRGWYVVFQPDIIDLLIGDFVPSVVDFVPSVIVFGVLFEFGSAIRADTILDFVFNLLSFFRDDHFSVFIAVYCLAQICANGGNVEIRSSPVGEKFLTLRRRIRAQLKLPALGPIGDAFFLAKSAFEPFNRRRQREELQ